MRQLIGEYECKIDAKGRMKMPTSLLKQLGELPEGRQHEFVINRGVEHCLVLYPRSVWDVISLKVNQLNQYIKKNREFKRYFYRGATDLSPDSADRVLLSRRLLEYAGIEKTVTLLGLNDRIEIWSQERYDKLISEEPEDFSDLAEEVWGPKDIGPISSMPGGGGSSDSDE